MSRPSLRRKAATLLVVAALSGSGLYATFTESTSTEPQHVTSATGAIELTAGNLRQSVDSSVLDLVPGDSISRDVVVHNGASYDLSQVSLTVTDPNPHMELLLSGLTTTVQRETPIGSGVWETIYNGLSVGNMLSDIGGGVLTAGGSTHLRVLVAFSGSDDDGSLKGASASFTYTFQGTQRDGVSDDELLAPPAPADFTAAQDPIGVKFSWSAPASNPGYLDANGVYADIRLAAGSDASCAEPGITTGSLNSPVYFGDGGAVGDTCTYAFQWGRSSDDQLVGDIVTSSVTFQAAESPYALAVSADSPIHQIGFDSVQYGFGQSVTGLVNDRTIANPGTALYLPGSSLTYTNTTAPSGTASIEIWVKPSSESENPAFGFYNSDSTYDEDLDQDIGRGWEMWVDELGRIEFHTGTYGTVGYHTVVSAPVVVSDEENHVVITLDGSTIRFYVNGSLADSKPFAHGLLGASGLSAYVGDGGDVTVDAYAIYDSALSPARVQAHWVAGQ